MELLDTWAILRSPVVANCRMNRERQLSGRNGYQRELNLDVPAFLRDRLGGPEPVAWVDLCCGSAQALVEAADHFAQSSDIGRIRIEGVDLAGLFKPNSYPNLLTLRAQTIEDWSPTGPYDLVTCVHGLHYVGDKLAAIAKAVAHVSANGQFLANLDLASMRHADGRSAARTVAARLRAWGLIYDRRRRILRCEGPRHIDGGVRYLGADDTVGPNYTGQPAVASYYDFSGVSS